MIFSCNLIASLQQQEANDVDVFPLVVLFASVGKVTVKSLSACDLYRISLESHKPVSFPDVSRFTYEHKGNA